MSEKEAMAGLMSGGALTFKFEKKGDTVVGIVEALERRQDEDMNTKKPLTWPNGDPVYVYLITLRTELRDPANEDDDGTRVIWCRNRCIAAVREAFKKEGLTGSDSAVGGKLGVRYVGDDQPKQRGHNGAKMYKAKFEKGVKSDNWDDEQREPGDESESEPQSDEEIPFD